MTGFVLRVKQRTNESKRHQLGFTPDAFLTGVASVPLQKADVCNEICAVVETSWKNTVAGGEYHARRASRFWGVNGMVGSLNFLSLLNLFLSYE